MSHGVWFTDNSGSSRWLSNWKRKKKIRKEKNSPGHLHAKLSPACLGLQRAHMGTAACQGSSQVWLSVNLWVFFNKDMPGFSFLVVAFLSPSLLTHPRALPAADAKECALGRGSCSCFSSLPTEQRAEQPQGTLSCGCWGMLPFLKCVGMCRRKEALGHYCLFVELISVGYHHPVSHRTWLNQLGCKKGLLKGFLAFFFFFFPVTVTNSWVPNWETLANFPRFIWNSRGDHICVCV